MAWSSPKTWSTGEVVTAALANAQWRDNFLETAPAKVTTAGDLVIASAANTLARFGLPAALEVLRVNAGGTAWEADNLSDKADASALTSHTGDTANPHSVTAAQAGAPTTAQFDTLDEVDAGARIYGYKNLGGAL